MFVCQTDKSGCFSVLSREDNIKAGETNKNTEDFCKTKYESEEEVMWAHMVEVQLHCCHDSHEYVGY